MAVALATRDSLRRRDDDRRHGAGSDAGVSPGGRVLGGDRGPGADTARARAALEETYANERFVRVLPEGETPSLQGVRGSNFCDVAVFGDERNDGLILLSALDNLVKGASGQAVQCANLMCGLPEELGLLEAPLVP